MSCPHVPHLCPMALYCSTATVSPPEACSTLTGTLLPHPGHPPCPVPQGKRSPRSIRWGPLHRSQDGMSPRAEDAGRAAHTAGCGCQMFLTLFLFSQTPTCKLSNTISAVGTPAPDSSRPSWVTEMCRVRQGSAGHRVPAASHHAGYGQVPAVVCTTQTSWRAVQRSGMVARAGLGGELLRGIWIRGSHSGQEDILYCRLSPWVLRDSVLCSCFLQPQGHISPGNRLLQTISHSTDPAVTSHQQLKVLISFLGLHHSQAPESAGFSSLRQPRCIPTVGRDDTSRC